MAKLRCSDQFSEILFLCGLEETILSILGISYISINQTKYTAMKHLLPYKRKYKYQLFF